MSTSRSPTGLRDARTCWRLLSLRNPSLHAEICRYAQRCSRLDDWLIDWWAWCSMQRTTTGSGRRSTRRRRQRCMCSSTRCAQSESPVAAARLHLAPILPKTSHSMCLTHRLIAYLPLLLQIHYFHTKTKMTGFFQTSFYFGCVPLKRTPATPQKNVCAICLQAPVCRRTCADLVVPDKFVNCDFLPLCRYTAMFCLVSPSSAREASAFMVTF